MAEIIHQLVIRASSDKVFHAIAKQKGLSCWWIEDVVAENLEGAFAEFRFGEAYFIKMKICKLEKNRKVFWECVEGDDEWMGTRIQFDLEEQGEKTLLKFNHSDWKEMTDFFAHCNFNWGWYLASLKEYCETGKGKPFSTNS